MSAYYSENDPYAAAWLENLIDAGHIAPGIVDRRSIVDVVPDDLAGFTQCHFFAGIGVWSLALRCAGWPDDREAWTGSCPCQPFSQAGKGGGFADERHLWPAFYHLISQRRPPVVFGEQVASPNGYAWLDVVQADLEGAGYACGAVVFPAAGIGAPHIRHRQWFVAHTDDAGLEGRGRMPERAGQRSAGQGGLAGELGNAADEPRQRRAGCVPGAQASKHGPWIGVDGRVPVGPQHAGQSVSDGLVNAKSSGVERASGYESGPKCSTLASGEDERRGRLDADYASEPGDRPGPVNGFWADADWISCRDGKWRAVEPKIQCLAHGVAQRMGRLRANGNAIVVQVATEVIESYMAQGAAL